MVMCRETYRCPPSQYRARRLRGVSDDMVRILCDLWHCRPEDLRQERVSDAVMHIEMLAVEKRVERRKAEAQRGRI